MIRPRPIGPGIEVFAAKTPTLPPATHTNSYALGERDALLVEPATPYEDERREWLEWARGFASQGRKLVALFLTHHHNDHTGGAAFFSRSLELPIWAHESTADRLPDLRVDRRLADGDTIVLDGPSAQKWAVLHTPGHAPGHLCLLEQSLGQVIVGDMVASEGTILIDPRDGDMREYLGQLERLENLRAACALPAHGDPIENPSALFSHYVSHRKNREAKILSALGRFGSSGAEPEDLVPIAYDDTPKRAWGLAALSVRAHLVKLVSDGRAAEDGQRYRLSSS